MGAVVRETFVGRAQAVEAAEGAGDADGASENFVLVSVAEIMTNVLLLPSNISPYT